MQGNGQTGKNDGQNASGYGAVSQNHITLQTPMGANLVADGATFRVFAPQALEVHVRLAQTGNVIGFDDSFAPSTALRLQPNADGHWTGFVPGVQEGDHYLFYLVGSPQPLMRDPYARELEFHDWPNVDCIVRDPNSYPWQSDDFQPPRIRDQVIYQLHVGTFYAVDKEGNDNRANRIATFLDVVDRVPYLAALGINALQLLSIMECQGQDSFDSSLPSGRDLFAPDMDYAVAPADLGPYLPKINALLTEQRRSPLIQRNLEPQINQLKALVDICHLHGIAVIFHVDYFGAGVFGEDDWGKCFENAYCADLGWAVGMKFDHTKAEVQRFLIDNGKYFIDEYHVDGLHYEQLAAIDLNDGCHFLKQLFAAVRNANPETIQIAEYERHDPSAVIRSPETQGAGCDAVWHDGLGQAIRGAIAQASQGSQVHVDLEAIREQLYLPAGFAFAWQVVRHIENYIQQRFDNPVNRQPRVSALAGGFNKHSRDCCSRARVGNGLLLTAPGTPMLFMGQEFLEDKYWSDEPENFPDTLISWDDLQSNVAKREHLHFITDVIHLRRNYAALRGGSIHVFHVNNSNRIIAFHRWLEDIGGDVVVVASLNESTFGRYELGLPLAGVWFEVLNSDRYDSGMDPQTEHNIGDIRANGAAMHELPHSATITVPAHSILVLAHENSVEDRSSL